jgi:PAS domain S-box-containing protein
MATPEVGGAGFYRTLLENSFEGIAIVDTGGLIRFQNRAAAEILGAMSGELIGTSAMDLIHPDDLPIAASSLATLNANQGVTFPDTVRMKRRDDGRYVDLETRAINLAHDPEIQGIIINFRDVSQQRAAMRALHSSEQRLDLAMAASDVALWDWDLEANRITFDGRLAKLLAVAPEEIGKSREDLRRLIHPEDEPDVLDALQGHLEGTRDHFDVEHRMRAGDGGYRWVHARGAVVERDPGGKPKRLIGTHLDIDRRRRDEEQRLALEERLQAVQRMESIGQLAGGIAHDFNNVLQIVIANATMALARPEDRKGTEESLHQIRQAGERAAGLTRQLLAFARRQALSPRPSDVNDLVRASIAMLRRVLPESIEIDFVPGHNLPPALLDAGQFEQVITNLCVNARDAMPNGGRLTIETESVFINGEYQRQHPWAKAGRYVLLSLSDTGAGMDEATRRRAFEPFFTTKGDHGGTGLGLAMVHGTVRQHGGLVHLYSEPGVGTTFKLYWPVAERAAAGVGAKLDGPVPQGAETVLLAEDDAAVRSLTARILRSAGYSVLTASDGDEAVEVFRASQRVIDLVLLDGVMPKKSGREVYEVISAMRPTAVLFISGYSAASLPPAFLAGEDLSVLPKPYSPDVLLRRIRELLDKHRRTPA